MKIQDPRQISAKTVSPNFSACDWHVFNDMNTQANKNDVFFANEQFT